MKQKRKRQRTEVIIRQRKGLMFLEIRMSDKLRKEMAALAEKTAGTISAV